MTARRAAIEGRMLRSLGMTEGARARLVSHNFTQTDWHGWCRVCRTHFSGSIRDLSIVCPVCGAASRAGTGYGTTSR